MKRVITMISMLLLILMLAGCSKEAVDKEVVLTLQDGTVTGIYSGQIRGKSPHGSGTFTKTGDDQIGWTYTGEWLSGLMDGKGISEWEDGNRYEGEFKGGVKSGKGAEYFKDELLFLGTFENGMPIELEREEFELKEEELTQRVQAGNVGFKIPAAWDFDQVQDNYLRITDPEAKGVEIGISVFEKRGSEINTELKDGYITSLSKVYENYTIVSEDSESSPLPTYNLKVRFYRLGELLDFNCYVRRYKDTTVVLTVMQLNGLKDYEKAARSIIDTITKKNKVEEIDWENLDSKIVRVSADEIIHHNAPKNKTIVTGGIIHNLTSSTFELWMPYESTYYRNDNWRYSINLSGIGEGDTVEIIIETHPDGSLKQSDGILAIRKLDVPAVSDMVSVFKESCPAMDYGTIMRNPEKAYGTICKATGTIFQVVKSGEGQREYLLELDSGEIVYTTIFMEPGSDQLLEDDRVTFYGTFYVMKTYTGLLGKSNTVPVLAAIYADLK